MPNIQSAKKRMRQNVKRKVRNYATRAKLKTEMKRVLDHVKSKEQDQAEKALPHAYKVIDTAAKKKIIHRNNAARKKARLAKEINKLKTAK